MIQIFYFNLLFFSKLENKYSVNKKIFRLPTNSQTCGRNFNKIYRKIKKQFMLIKSY